MIFEDKALVYGPMCFERSAIGALKFEGDHLLVYLHASKEWVDLGVPHPKSPWPFDDTPLRHEALFFLPEHIVGFHDEHGKPLRVWTKLEMLEIQDSSAGSFQAQKQGIANTTRAEWVAACKASRSNHWI